MRVRTLADRLVQVFDYDSVTDHDLIGEFTTSVQDLLTRHTERATASSNIHREHEKWAETSRGSTMCTLHNVY